MRALGIIFIAGNNNSFYVDRDYEPNIIIPLLKVILKESKTAKDVSDALLYESGDPDGCFHLNDSDLRECDYKYIINPEYRTINCVLKSFDSSVSKKYISDEYVKEKYKYGNLGNVILRGTKTGTDITLFVR